MKILLIEDDDEKSQILSAFLREEFSGCTLDLARSLNSGLRAIVKGQAEYSVILLDMSMPNYDISHEEPGGGKPESFAGEDLLSQMKLRGVVVPTIVVTMFGSFGEDPNKMSLERLVERLKANFQPTFRGFTYYNSAQEGWRASLRNLIQEILKDG
ncbi:hypothetical protein [Paraburkholderia xenovorans]|jgi:CheY-like chemotaxis protein